MYPNQNLQKPTEFKLKRPVESDSVAKDKRYKLGEWLHGDYKKKYKKAADRSESLNNLSAFR